MKSIRLVSCLFAVSLVAPLAAQTPAPSPRVEFPAPSPTGTVKQRIGVTDVEVVYSRPGVKGRKIFGGLEAWGKVWRTGANSATKVTFSTPVKFGGVAVPAGSYALYSIPGEAEWTVILSKVTGQWGAYSYDPKDDVARVTAKPVALAELVETFTIDVNDIRDTSATFNLVWEKTRVPVKIELDLLATLPAQVEALMASAAEKKPYAQAAMFYFENGLDLAKAEGWMDAAIQAQPDAFYLVYRKGLIQEKRGDKAGAVASALKSLEMAKAQTGVARDEYIRLNEALLARLK